MTTTTPSPLPLPARNGRRIFWIAAAALAVMVIAVAVIIGGGSPDPTESSHGNFVRVIDIGVLVFREGLESILVLAAITASMVGGEQRYRRPIALGTGLAFIATLITWRIAIGIVDSLTENLPALDVQAATGLLAIIVLLVVMNWFFHKVYWTGWIAMHTKRKRALMRDASAPTSSGRSKLQWGLIALGFTSLYREGFEVVLFLQSYRLQFGNMPVLQGVGIGLAFTAIVALLTFVAHQRLPYKRMLVITGVMLGVVLLVMVGEQAQEMQLAHWISTTPIHSLERVIPSWMGLWFAVFPTMETLVAQGIAAVLVVGSFGMARLQVARSS
jgi:high-affinity iron transporter